MTITYNGDGDNLEKRLNDLKNQKVLVRAINPREFEQLQKDGPSRFKFNQWTNYEVSVGPQVREFCRGNETGTVIIFPEPEPGFIRKYFRGANNLASPLYACLENFYGKVEVFNLSCDLD